MQPLTQLVSTITNGLNNLGRKIDTLINEVIRSNKTPVVNVSPPQVNVDIGNTVSREISNAIKEGLEKVEMPKFEKFPEFPVFPEFKEPKVTVNVPAIDISKLKLPTPIVNVSPANITVEPTPVTFPDKINIVGMDKLLESVNRETPAPTFDFNSKNPLAVMVVDRKGKHIEDFVSELTAPSMVAIRVGTSAVGSTNPLPVTTDGFSIPKFDTQEIDESLAPASTTITYKLASVTVAVKTITVSGTLTTISVVIS